MTSEPALPEVISAGPEPRAEGGVMPLVEHLAELRTRIVWSIIAIAVGSVVGFLASDWAIDVLRSPLPVDQPLIYLDIGDPFAIRIKISIVIGVILAMPVILWHVWRFVAPGLTATERRAVLPWIPATLVFFAI